MTIEQLPLSALVSKVLLAFTIEFDYEFERRMPHRMAISRSLGLPARGPWLVSQAMWANFMRCVDKHGRSIATIESLTRMAALPLPPMERWGYVIVEPDPSDKRPKPPRADWNVRPTEAGRKAQEIWAPLGELVESRWQTRFGAGAIAQLRDALASAPVQTDIQLPDYLPIVGYGLWTKGLLTKRPIQNTSEQRAGSSLDLSVLLSRVLLLFAMEFEDESPLSLAICANCLRVLGVNETPVRELPILTGISSEAVAVSLGYLQREGYASVDSDQNDGRTKVATLTTKGIEGQTTASRRLTEIEQRWSSRLGEPTLARLRESLAGLLTSTDGTPPRIAEGLQPPQGAWRATKLYARQTAGFLSDPAGALPQFPVVSHRGGFPDGS